MPLDAMDFPFDPVPGQTYTTPSGAKYIFDGFGWTVTYDYVAPTDAPAIKVTPHLTSSPTPPSNPVVNDLWYSTVSGFLFLWYNDGNTIQWVVANPGKGREIGPMGLPGPAGPRGLPGPPGPVSTDVEQHPYVRVEAFGGGQGIDDSAAFRLAAADGRVIALSANTVYRVKNVNIPVDSPCPGIVSLGGQARIVPPNDYVKDDYFFMVRKENDFSFDGLFFDMPLNLDPFMDYRFNRAIWLAPTTGNRGRNYRVENCTFSGGSVALSGVGYIIENSRFANNHVSGTLGDGFSFNAVINVDIVDNVFEGTGLCAPGATISTSGAIRTGTDTQLDTSRNVEISSNVITGCSVPTGQSAIDCFSGAARNLRITDNICSYNGAGIELKTTIWTLPDPLPPDASNVYENNVIADNTIRLFSDRTTNGITVFLTGALDTVPKGKAANVQISDNIISSTVPVVGGAFSHNAISVQGHDNVLIDSNQIFNCGRGVLIGGGGVAGGGPIGRTSDNITVSNNTIDVVGMAVQHSGGTLNHVYVRNNPLLRSGADTVAAAVVFQNTATDVDISGNRIECLSATRQAVDIQGMSNSRITDNTIIATGPAVVMSGVVSSNVKFRDNEIISASATAAFNLSTGTGIEVAGNNIEVPVGSSTVSGAAAYLPANNIRGLRTAIPDATIRGTLGDIFLDATATTAGWRCTTAGLPAVWTVI